MPYLKKNKLVKPIPASCLSGVPQMRRSRKWSNQELLCYLFLLLPPLRGERGSSAPPSSFRSRSGCKTGRERERGWWRFYPFYMGICELENPLRFILVKRETVLYMPYNSVHRTVHLYSITIGGGDSPLFILFLEIKCLQSPNQWKIKAFLLGYVYTVWLNFLLQQIIIRNFFSSVQNTGFHKD